MCIYMYTRVFTSLNESKKGGETSKLTNFKRGNIGITNMHKKYRRQDRDRVIYWLGIALAFVLPHGGHASTSPILSQSIKLLHDRCITEH